VCVLGAQRLCVCSGLCVSLEQRTVCVLGAQRLCVRMNCTEIIEEFDETDNSNRPHQVDIPGMTTHVMTGLRPEASLTRPWPEMGAVDLEQQTDIPKVHTLASAPTLHSRRQRRKGKATGFDVFISYRVVADAKLVESLYDKLKALEVVDGGRRRPLRVFWDKVCLIAGKDFESGFAQALCNSRVVVFVMSRSAYKNIDDLSENSPCDNFILEHALALELVDAKSISAVLPVFVGDLKSYEGVGSIYNNFFQSCCLPRNIPDIVLSAVQEKTNEYLCQLGVKASAPRTLHQIFKDITQFQGAFLEGAERPAIENAVKVIHDCACRQLVEENDHLHIEHFQFSTPLGHEVYNWLKSNMLTEFASAFARHKIDSLYKISLMTSEQVDAVNKDHCENLALSGSSRRVGSQIMLVKAIYGLKKDERAFSCTERLEQYKDTNVAWRMCFGANNQLEVLLSKPVWRLWLVFFIFVAVPGLLIALFSLCIIFDASILSGRPASSVTSVRILVGVNGSDWRPVDCGKGLGVQCNILADTAPFSRPEYARFIKIFPAEWEPGMFSIDPQMKLGILGTPDTSHQYFDGIGDRLDYLVLGSGSAGEYWLQDACTRDPPGIFQGRWESAEHKLGKVQCCLFSPDLHVCTRDGCLSGHNPSSHVNVTWQGAQRMCESKGWRLCSRAELTAKGSSGCCANNQCGYDNELVWTSTHRGVQLEQCNKENAGEKCNFPSCRGWCVEGACFKGAIDPRCHDKPKSHKLDDGRWCWQGFSGYYCPTQVGSIDGNVPMVFESEHNNYLTMDVHTPQIITGILIQGGSKQRPLIFTSLTCATQFLSISFTFAPILGPMILLSRTSPMKGARCLIPGLIYCHLLHGLILGGLLFDYFTGAIPSLISTNFTCRTWGAWTIRAHTLLSFSLYVWPPALIFLQLLRPKYMIICMLLLWGIVTITMAVLGFEWWFQWTLYVPFLLVLTIFLCLTYILRARTQREALQLADKQKSVYEGVWAKETAGSQTTAGGGDRQENNNPVGMQLNEQVEVETRILTGRRNLRRTKSTIRVIDSDTSVSVYNDSHAFLRCIGEMCHDADSKISQTREHELQSFAKSCPSGWYRTFVYKLGVGGLGLYSTRGKRRQRIENLDILFETASILGDHFFELIQDMLFGNTTSGAIKGTASQGPSKHADRALQKTVRRYFRDHRCLTDLVRCCVILDSIEVSSPCQRLPSYLNLIYVTCILKVHS